MQWTLDQLRQFVLTAESGSFSEAARRLGRAQSAVSTAIGLLEADLGVELFDRSRRNAQLTDAGALLLLEARELLRQGQSLEQRALSLSAGGEAKLTLALDEALPDTAVGTLIREIAQRFPDLELTLLNGTATEVAEYVDQQRAQMAIHFVRGALPARFDQRHMGTVSQGLFVPMGHPLTRNETVQRRDLVPYRQLILHADDVHETAYSPKVWRADSFYALARMVAYDLGWAILPVNIATHDSYRQPLQQLDCPSLALPQLSVRVLWCQGWQPGPAANWVQARFTELLR
ncbi:LysR family transcriptional regulator [Comamonas endophytica]|uniref:LysR family transcriptional regulator n=1 Tax=Comamonas endophytica TaxID=2949090 RepID=A0ABY6GFG2_9BURK|nr:MULTISPECIES: LysR family transcriptional regulator [unclassified Acidovorax]MCD2513383.1 LysR family transcriptional regulator [Acidovorax sp. D4N7]UYG53834.1 LysR family transcriptional regulator [Acidovorax sp. 5MLIR]